MGFRNSGQRGDRRRRLLFDGGDERQSSQKSGKVVPDAAEMGPTSDAPSNYSADANRENLQHWIDLLPSRWGHIALAFTLALVSVTILGRLHLENERLASILGTQSHHLFVIGAVGSFAAWWTATLFGAAAIISVMIYALRRHKLDDYRGTYRVWNWAAILAVCVSIDVTTNLHGILAELLAQFTGTPLLVSANGGAAWWILLAGLPLLGMLVRLAIEMRSSKGALATLIAAACFYGVAGSDTLGLIRVDPESQWAVFGSVAGLLAHALVALSLMLYLRYVVRDSQGLLPQQAATSEALTGGAPAAVAKSATKPLQTAKVIRPAKQSVPQQKRTDLDTPKLASAPKPATKIDPAPSTGEQMDTEAAELGVDPDEYARMPKAQRRRLRKQHRRQSKKAG